MAACASDQALGDLTPVIDAQAGKASACTQHRSHTRSLPPPLPLPSPRLQVYVKCSRGLQLGNQRALRPVFIVIFATMALMYMRNIFRTAESVQGFGGYLGTHEAYLYIFDFAPIATSCLLFTAVHFGVHLPQPEEQRAPEADVEKGGKASQSQDPRLSASGPRVAGAAAVALGLPVYVPGQPQQPGSSAGATAAAASGGAVPPISS